MKFKTIAWLLVFLLAASPLFAQLNQSGGSGGGGGGASNITQIAGVAVSVAAAGIMKVGLTDGTGNAITSTGGNLNVQCANCSGSGVSTVDAAAFVASTSLFAGGGGFFQTTATSNPLTNGQQGLFQVTANRALFTNLRNASGAEVGVAATPIQVSLANTAANGTAVTVSGTVTANAGTNLNTSLLALEAGGNLASVVANAGATTDAAVTTDVNATLSSKLRGLVKILGNVWDSGNSRLNVFLQNATLAVTQSTSPWVDNITQFGSSAVVTGFGPAGAGIPRFTASSDDLVGNVTVNVASSTTPCPAASASAVTTSASCIQIPLAGFTGVAAEIQAGTLIGTVAYEYSSDGGATWNAALASAGSIQTVTGTTYAGANGLTAVNFLVGNTTSHVRVRVQTFTSGAAVVYVRASKMIGALAVGSITAAIPGLALPLLGSQTSIRAVTATPTAVTTNTSGFLTGDVYGVLYTRVDHPARIKCSLTTAATTSTLVTGCAAPSAGLSNYITDISLYGGVANAITAASTIQTGTGGTCGTATTVVYYCQHAGIAGCEAHFLTPLKTTTVHEICLLDAATGTKFVTVSGYVAP